MASGVLSFHAAVTFFVPGKSYRILCVQTQTISSQSFIIKFKCSVQPALASPGCSRRPSSPAEQSNQFIYWATQSSYKIFMEGCTAQVFTAETNLAKLISYLQPSIQSPLSNIQHPPSPSRSESCYDCFLDVAGIEFPFPFLLSLSFLSWSGLQWNEYRN